MCLSKTTNMNNTGYGEINIYQINKKYCKSLGMKDPAILDLAFTEDPDYQYLVSISVF